MDNLVDMVLKEHRYVTKRSGDKVIFESDKMEKKNDAIRGLSLFIGDIRNCSNKEQEDKVV